MNESKAPTRVAGLLERLVNHVSHSTGASLAVMQRAELTLPQVLLLNRVAHGAAASTTALAASTGGSLSAVSQMIDRLVRQGFLTRHRDAADRRRGVLQVTPSARAVLRRLAAARRAEYAQGLGRASPKRLGMLERVLEPLVTELDATSAGRSELRARRSQ
ncbi:MAG: MarR family transcriptional regulator [Gemmatimonadaceae bacterium]